MSSTLDAAGTHQVRAAVLWHDTVLTDLTAPADRPLRVGEAPDNHLMVPDVGGLGAHHVLLEPAPGGAVLHLTAGMRNGQLRLNGVARPLADVRAERGAEVLLCFGDEALIDLGPFALLLRFDRATTAPPRRTVASALEASMLGSLLAALTVHVGALLAAFLFWAPEPAFATLDLQSRPAIVRVQPPEPEPEDEPVADAPDTDRVAKAAEGLEGAFGEPDKKDRSRVPTRDAEPVKKATTVGVHRALGSDLLGRGPLKSVMGRDDGFAAALDAAAAGADGDLHVGRGAGAMGLRGTGNGGGGTGFGSIHGMGTLDAGKGKRAGAKLGRRTKTARKPPVRRGPPALTGYCKEADLLKVVQARQKGIAYCYEKALRGNPELAGKLTLSWRIRLDGRVAAAFVEGDTVGDAEVARCAVRAVKTWRFPAPEGGLCQVRFPFVFDPGL
jgi:hypothetical protein